MAPFIFFATLILVLYFIIKISEWGAARSAMRKLESARLSKLPAPPKKGAKPTVEQMDKGWRSMWFEAWLAVDYSGHAFVHETCPERDEVRGRWVSDEIMFEANHLLLVPMLADITWDDRPIHVTVRLEVNDAQIEQSKEAGAKRRALMEAISKVANYE